ncbi:MAG: 4Fe-4S binding protein [Bacteroides sp.]|nr:4Fe-4S binding protein [Bacteroides sp.]
MARRKVTLFIGDRPVDLSDNSLILYNYQMDDLTNPAAVKNSYSQQVTLPGTANNNRIFGEIFKLDTIRQEYLGTDLPEIGANFKPWRRTSFAIYDEIGQKLESGYMRLDNVNRSGTLVSYTISLFGGLGSFFYSLMYNEDGDKLSLADLDYLGTDDPEHELDFNITAKAVGEAWGACWGRPVPELWKVINFTPAYNGIPDDFSADVAIAKPESIGLKGEDKEDKSKVYKTKDGYALIKLAKSHTEWEVKDLRSYLQRPVINMRKILEAIAKPKNNGGYYVDFSDIMDNKNFPLANDLWMTLPMLKEVLKEDPKTHDIVASFQSPWSKSSTVATYKPEFGNELQGYSTGCTINFALQYEANPAEGNKTLYLSNQKSGANERASTAIFIQAVGVNNSGKDVSGSDVIILHNLKNNSQITALQSFVKYVPEYYSEDSKPTCKAITGVFNYIASDLCRYKFSQDLSLSMETALIDHIDVRIKVYEVVESAESLKSFKELENNSPRLYASQRFSSDYLSVPASNGCVTRIQNGKNDTFSAILLSKRMSGRFVDKRHLLGSTRTPADYLLSFCKIFGLYMLYDHVSNTVKIYRRNTLYQDKVIDATDRIDGNSIKIEPLSYSSKNYEFALPDAGGAFSDFHKAQYGKGYGIERFDTQYGFNSDTFGVMNDNVFKNAISLLENSVYYNDITKDKIPLPSVFIDNGNTYTLWNVGSDGKEEAKTLDISRPTVAARVHYWHSKYKGYDYSGADKLQLHGSDGKSVDGSNILLFSTGRYTECKYFHLTDDSYLMEELNGGKMCWDLTQEIFPIINMMRLPVFSRYIIKNESIEVSLDLGKPQEIGIPSVAYPSDVTVYEKMWKGYFEDRYGKFSQAKVMKCKMDLRGLNVGYGLLRQFYWFENTLWAMNRISNYSITTDDMVEVELVQVYDKHAYDKGQRPYNYKIDTSYDFPAGSKPALSDYLARINDECISCGTCEAVCRYNAISQDGNYSIDENKCTGCQECVYLCPVEAIEIIKKN